MESLRRISLERKIADLGRKAKPIQPSTCHVDYILIPQLNFFAR
jgi:hypothetical protein